MKNHIFDLKYCFSTNNGDINNLKYNLTNNLFSQLKTVTKLVTSQASIATVAK